MIHKASKHQKRNRKIRDRNPSRADKINTVSRTCVRMPALGLRSTPAGCCVVCIAAAMHRNALYLHDAVWKQWLLIQQALDDSVGLVTQCALPLLRHKMTERSRLLPFTCYRAMAQPCSCGWTPAWVSSGSVEGCNVTNIFPLCRDCISAVVAGLRASFHGAALCVENHSIAGTTDPSTRDIKVSVLCP